MLVGESWSTGTPISVGVPSSKSKVNESIGIGIEIGGMDGFIGVTVC